MNNMEKSRVLLLNVKSILKIVNEKNTFINIIEFINYSIDRIDNDKEVMNSSEMINLEKRKVINYKNQSVDKFHHDILEMIDNNSSTKFLIFKN